MMNPGILLNKTSADVAPDGRGAGAGTTSFP